MKSMWWAFWVVVALLLSATAVVSRVVYQTPAPPSSTALFESIKAMLLCLGGSGVILSTYFTAVNAFVQRRADIIQNTFHLLASWDDPHLFQARKLTRRAKETREDTSNNGLIEEIEKNEDLKNSVILVLNYFEHIHFSLITRRIDKRLFKRALGATVVDIIDRFMPFAKKQGDQVVADLIALKKLLQEE
ncbi:hypothetical protein L2Y96_21755 [Luteibacter aegosomaticola]|uniref:DUF4760 domain-containing protein n=1 Tax=Luteibacter aegosomaticola TaxID=2911538 RepID=UPI001FF97D5B|nr:hypothetical protein [Luteibacter aegosomaticola]UPG89970.1 hypothetical protein L2Y96_21755 [Luteibacter aegosomaticola]